MNIAPHEDWQAERLSRWLLEWELLQVPQEEDAATETETDATPLPEGCVAPADDDIEVGQIRLMMPRTAEDVPLFLAVTGETTGDTAFCVPFSQLNEPATPDELLSGRDTPVVSVYCLWNARGVAVLVLQESWIVDTLTEDELTRLRRALLACEQTGGVPDDLRREAGPPCVHPEDPRRLYRRIEHERLDSLLVREHIRQSPDNVILYKIESDQRELPKAAEDHDTYEV